MGLRYRKSINLGGGARITLSKSGIGYSWGGKGFRFTKTAKGRSRASVYLPGAGLSYVTESSGKKRRKKTRSTAKKSSFSIKNFFVGLAVVLAVALVIVAGPYLLIAAAVAGVIFLIGKLFFWKLGKDYTAYLQGLLDQIEEHQNVINDSCDVEAVHTHLDQLLSVLDKIMDANEDDLRTAGMTKETMPEQKQFILDHYDEILQQARDRNILNVKE